MWKFGAEVDVLECDADVQKNIHTEAVHQNLFMEEEAPHLPSF